MNTHRLCNDVNVCIMGSVNLFRLCSDVSMYTLGGEVNIFRPDSEVNTQK